jgi:hypothetical protein
MAVRVGAAATGVVALGSAVLSWDALSWGARQLGVDAHLTWLYPVVIDGTIVVGTVTALALRGAEVRIRLYVWTLLVGAISASVIGNGAHAAGGSPIHMVGASVPAVALAASLHLLVILVRHAPEVPIDAAEVAEDGQPDRPEDRSQDSRADKSDRVTEDVFRQALREVGTGQTELADHLGVTKRSVRRYERRWPAALAVVGQPVSEVQG